MSIEGGLVVCSGLGWVGFEVGRGLPWLASGCSLLLLLLFVGVAACAWLGTSNSLVRAKKSRANGRSRSRRNATTKLALASLLPRRAYLSAVVCEHTLPRITSIPPSPGSLIPSPVHPSLPCSEHKSLAGRLDRGRGEGARAGSLERGARRLFHLGRMVRVSRGQ